MTTYTLQGISFIYDEVAENMTQVSPETLTIVVPDSSLGFTYEEVPGQFDRVEITSSYSTISVGGTTYSHSSALNTLDAYFGYFNWGSGNTSYTLTLETGGSALEYFFVIGGATIPTNPTLAEINAWNDSITADSVVTSGPYAPNTNIAFATIPGIISTENDVILGGAGNDVFYGGVGNDTLNGGDGFDTLSGGDGRDILIGGNGDDILIGGTSIDDLRDVIYGGDGNDTINGGAGNDVMTGSAFGDEIHGGDGNDFVNGGFGHDRVNGGAGADKFYHLGIFDHGADWIQDYNAADGDVLLWGGGAATADDFLVQVAETANAGVAGVEEIFVTHIPSGVLLWALVDGDAQAEINIQINGQVFDLLG